METISIFLMYVALLFVPILLVRRIRTNSFSAAINPSMYLVFFSYVYLTIGSLLAVQYKEELIIFSLFRSMSDESISVIRFYSNYYTLVFLAFYLASKDKRFSIKAYHPKATTAQISMFLLIGISFIFLIIIAINFQGLLGLSRDSALEKYAEINSTFKVNVLVNIALGSFSVLLWKSDNLKYAICLVPPILLELLTQGRTLSFSIITFFLINLFLVKARKANFIPYNYLRLGIVIIVGLASTVLIRGEVEGSSSVYQILFVVMSDVPASWLSAVVTYDSLLAQGDVFSYLSSSVYKLLPNVVGTLLSTNTQSLDTALIDVYRQSLPYSLASNILSEALFYGGISFTIVSPFIIGAIFYVLNEIRIYQTFPGYLFCCYLVSNMRVMMRSSFYDSFFVFTYLMFSYLLWITVLERGRKVFTFPSKVVKAFS